MEILRNLHREGQAMSMSFSEAEEVTKYGNNIVRRERR